MIPYFKLAAVAGSALLASGVVWAVVAHFNEFDRLQVAEVVSNQMIADLTAENDFKDRTIALEKQAGDQRVQLAERSAADIEQIRAQVRKAVADSELALRAATDAGRADLNRRGRERWRQTYDAIAQESDYSGLLARPGALRPGG